MTMRWRCPPDSLPGMELKIFSGMGMPTMPISSRARASASFRLIFLWAWMVSEICRPQVISGFRLVMGSWKIMAMSLPRFLHSSFSLMPTSSSPASFTLPPVTLPGAGTI